MNPDRVLSPEAQALLRAAGKPVEYARRKVLFREGDLSTSVLLIDTGEVKVTRVSLSGYVFLLAHRGPGQIVGEFGAASELPRGATVTTVTVVTGHSVTAERFRELLEQPRLARELFQLVTERVREADKHRLEMAVYPAMQRVIRVLLEQAERQRSDTVEILQQELASAAGTSVESVARAVRELRRRGAISTQPGRIVILDMDLLFREMAA